MTAASVQDVLRFSWHGRKRDGWAYACPEQFVIEHGVTFDMKPVPDDVERGVLGYCFANAWEVVSDRPEFEYVEGYAVGMLGWPIHHAWVLDTRDGKAFDVTWLEYGLHYLGVTFPRERVYAAQAESERYAVLSTATILREPWEG